MSARLPRTLRAILVLVAGGLAFWVATGVTLTVATGADRPETALAWWPWGAIPKAAIASRVLTDPNPAPEKLDRAERLATEAALREPSLFASVRTIAAIQDFRGHRDRARSLFRAAEGWTRRDPITELWLIEDSVTRNNANEAIQHYNRAMLTSPELRATLMPILISASADPEIRSGLVPILNQRPIWWTDYVRLIASTGTSVEALDATVRAVRPNILDTTEHILAADVLRRMVELKAYRRAAALTAYLRKIAGAPSGLLMDGEFEEGLANITPFGWALAESGSVRAYRDTVPAGGIGLWLVATAGGSGEVASQLLVLQPGHHALTGMAGGVSPNRLERPSISLACAEGAAIARFALPESGDDGQRFRFEFTVPAQNCAAQWLRISTAPAADTNAWIDHLQLVPAVPSSR